jgi:diguanylate cyclase (GGDEF)-like protein/PAS domain S-box-containing protein
MVVEDNAITCKTMRRYLEAASFNVVEASDGKTALARAAASCPALISLDMNLPDIDGFELLEQLRKIPAASQIPIIAVTGHLPERPTDSAGAAQFNDVLVKPVASSRVVRVIKALLSQIEPALSGRRRRALLAEDDLVQRKLLRLHLSRWGFDVIDVSNGADALRLALASPPDVVVSDVLMPHMDGLSLCLAIRREATLRSIPVVLVSSYHVDEIDRSLATRSGATAVVSRSQDMVELETALNAITRDGGPSPTQPALSVRNRSTREGISRLVGQLKREADVREELVESQATVTALLPFFERFSDLGAQDNFERADADKTLDVLLAGYLDASGAALGCAFIATPRSGLVLRSQLGYRGEMAGELRSFFGRLDLLERVLDGGTVLELPSQGLRGDEIDTLLRRASTASMILLPLALRGERLGVFVLGSHRRPRATDLIRVAEAARGPIAQALALSRSVAELTTSRQAFRGIVDSTSDGIVVTDAAGTITYANPAAREIFGYAVDDVTGRAIGEVMPFLAVTPEARNGTALRKDGATFPSAVTVTTYEDAPGHLLHAYLVRDLSLRTTLDQLAALANRDGLTELFNRRRFDEHMASRLVEAIRYELSGALILLDLDGFKVVNDTHGHAAGDAVLKAVAAILTTGTRTSDFVARLGGDEFALELPHIDVQDAVAVATKLLVTARGPIKWCGQVLQIGTSAGIAMYPQHGKTLECLMRAADAALYRSKAAGRNRVSIAEVVRGDP